MAALDVREQRRECRAVQRAAGVGRVIVPLADELPALVSLGFDVRLARLALGVEGVELLVEAFLVALARINRASGHRRPVSWGWPK